MLGYRVKPEELKNVTLAVHELGLGYQETLEALSKVSKDLGSFKHLGKIGKKSKLIKIGLALITFPEPTPISETLGAFVLSLGLIQTKMRQSALHIDDVYDTFRDVLGGLHSLDKELTK